jgi:hypothetical protein
LIERWLNALLMAPLRWSKK